SASILSSAPARRCTGSTRPTSRGCWSASSPARRSTRSRSPMTWPPPPVSRSTACWRPPRDVLPLDPGAHMLTTAAIDRVVRLALDEDAPWGDLTSEALIPAGAVSRAELVAREAGVFSGGDVFRAAFTTADSRIQVEILAEEGG